jgi:hypothetical protein
MDQSVEERRQNIVANLNLFGLEDKRVDCYAIHRDGRRAFVGNLLLSVACVSRLFAHPVTKGADGRREYDWLFNVSVRTDGKEIGTIDCDGKFHYSQAPDLRTGLAWTLATDGGADKVFTADAIAWLDKHLDDLITIVMIGTYEDPG